jgi:hypothetical protein
MKNIIKRLILATSPVLDILAAPLVLGGALFFKVIRRYGVARLPLCRRILWTVGVMPVTDHYYDPFFRKEELDRSLREDRRLSGIDLNLQGQLELLGSFDYSDELVRILRHPGSALEFYYDNPAFLSGDAEFFYSMVRYFKPRKLVEVEAVFPP